MVGERALSVLVVSADSAVRGATNSVLPLAGWKVADVPSASLAMHNLKVALPDVLLLDQKFQEADALALLRSLRYLPGNERVVVAVMVDSIDRATAVSYVRAGVSIFLAKPLDIGDVVEKLAEKVPDAGHLVAPEPDPDPLAKPLLVLASPNLNLKDLTEKSLADEFDLVFFDGTRGVNTDRRWASCLLVDDGIPGGLEALPTWRLLFGSGPAIALTARGGEVLPGYVSSLVKPVRDTVLKRAVRQFTGRLYLGIFPMVGGVVVRVRDGWQAVDDASFEPFLQAVSEAAAQTVATKRKWFCIDGPYIGASEHIPRTRMLYEAAARPKLHAGIVTLQPDTSRVALHCQIHPMYVHNTSANFIKAVQELA